MNRLFAFAWLVIIGTNVAHYYSETAAYQGAAIVVGAAYFLFLFRTQLLRLIVFADFLLVLALLGVPILLMLLADRSFERGAYTSQIMIVLVFVVSSVLALRVELNRSLAIAAFAIVAVGAALNLYELLVENNAWSIAPGRSAGFYINPNISAEALVGYGLAFLSTRSRKFGIPDLVLTCLIAVAVFSTFSRAGILAGVVLLGAATLIRGSRKHLPRLALGGVTIALLVVAFAGYVYRNVDLSEDATTRIFSLIEEGGVGDYREDRGSTALDSLDLAMENPLTGSGVGTIYEMPEGPHNMFLAMMVDYGIVGLIVYLVVIVRLLMTARRADRKFAAPILFFVAWLVIFSFTSHNLLGNTATIPLLGFALARAYQLRYSTMARRVAFSNGEAGRAMHP